MTKEELKEKIEAYEEIINDPSEDQTTRDFAAKKVLKLKDQIAPGYAVLSQTDDDEEIEVEEVEEVFGDDDEKFQEEVEEAEPKRTPPGPKAKKKKTTKKKGRGRPKKRGRPAKRKATKKAAPTKAKAKKMSKDLGLSVKECEELLEKYSSEDKARKSRLAKRKKAGKTAELSVSESLEKEVKTVKNKVEDKKTPTTKAQAKSQGSKITDLVKAILEGIDKKKDKITQIDAIIKGLVAEKKKIMSKKGTGAFLVGAALGGYAGYKAGLSKDKTELKDLFKGEKKLAKDFKDAVKDKKKKDDSYTEFEEIYAKGGKIDRDEPIVEFLVSTGDREHLSLFRPRDFDITFDNTDYKFIGKRDATLENLKAMDEEKLVQLMYGEDAYMSDYGVDIGDATASVHSIMTMGEFIDRGYAKGGNIKVFSDWWEENQELAEDIYGDEAEKNVGKNPNKWVEEVYRLAQKDNAPNKFAKGGTTYDKGQDKRIEDNTYEIMSNKSEIDHYGLASSDALGLAQENEDKINNIRQGTNKVLNNLYEKNPSLKMAHGGVPKNAKWEYPLYFTHDNREFVATYYSNEEDVNEADEDFDNRTYNDLTPDKVKEYVDDTSSSKSNYKFEERDVYELSKNDNFMDALEYALETSTVSPEKVEYAKGGEIEDMSYEELMDVVMEKNSSNQNEKLAKEIAKIQEFKYDADDDADFNLVVQDYLDKSTNKNDDEAREVLIQAFENTGTSYAKGGETEGEPFVGYLDKAEDGENFQHILEKKGMFEQMGGQYIRTAPEDEVKEFYEDRFEADTSGHKSRYAKGGKTPKFKVRKSFYRTTLGANEKTGTGEDMRNVYHLHIEGTGSGQNYLLHSDTVTDEFLEENAPVGYDSGFYVDEEVYVDFTDKDGNKKKGYMIVNNPDLAVRILRDKYNAVSIEDMLMEWEMEEKGKNFDDYTDSY